MAHDIQAPCDGDGVCMCCNAKPPTEEILTCGLCVSPWHLNCLASLPESLESALRWECPDCYGGITVAATVAAGEGSNLVTAIKAIEADASLTEREKARKRQELLSGKGEQDVKNKGKEKMEDKNLLDLLDESLKCLICMQLLDRPVTTQCGHNFCLKCFQKWVGQGKHTCAKCRSQIPSHFVRQPRINSSIVSAVRAAKMSKSIVSDGPTKTYHVVHNQDRPDKAYTTERAQKPGKANASCGKIFVTIPADHFGPIPAENDPERNQGVIVGESWEDRMECRQWGAHFPHIAGIAGQADYGAQSVALSGGYVDDEDHGEWFLYTGSGGRDLSGNKRTNKNQSFDQKFEKLNEALRVSCIKGYPVRVVRSHKEKCSSYAPVSGVRYDGVYRIEKCWRKVGKQGFLVCRYLFIRCDNQPAPWTSDDYGDRPRPLPSIKELNKAVDITERKGSPSWDFDEDDGLWKWMKPPPVSRKPVDTGSSEGRKRSRKGITKTKNTNMTKNLLKGFSCLICHQVMTLPVTTPCAHNFCKTCLQGAFVGKAFVRDRRGGGRALRQQKNVMLCPCCPFDISDYLKDLQVNRDLMAVIETLKHKAKKDGASVENASEEEAEGSEENPDHTSENTEAAANESEKACVSNDLEHPPKKLNCGQSSKKSKVDSENSDCTSENKEAVDKNTDLTSENENVAATDNDNAGASHDLEDPSKKRKRGRPSKKRKVDSENSDCTSENKEAVDKNTDLTSESKNVAATDNENAGASHDLEDPSKKWKCGRPCKKSKVVSENSDHASDIQEAVDENPDLASENKKAVANDNENASASHDLEDPSKKRKRGRPPKKSKVVSADES